MSISFGSARLLRYVITSAAKFSESAVINVSKNEFILKAIDPSTVALLVLEVPRESTIAYRVTSNEQLAVNLEDFSKVLKSAERDDTITLEWTQSSLIVSLERRGFKRTFTLPLMSSAGEVFDIELEYPNTYVVSPTYLYEGLESLERFGDVLKIEGSEEEIRLKAESELGEAEVVLSRERGEIEDSDVRAAGFSTSYTMKFITYFKPVIRVSEKLVLKVGSELPLYFESASQGMRIEYYVAPRAD
ncbi:MAG: hypothetical protein RMI56_01320 [Sulfolobales archaeon]|nr:hypothetical protein [Sulfolobales archaeon]MDW8082419.1 hypothetical protein [Sulfolobales archaeon]